MKATQAMANFHIAALNRKAWKTRRVADLMKEIHQTRYCETCEKETEHVVREDATEISYMCNECHHEQEIIKNFF